MADGFTKKYGIHRLVWYETHETAESATSFNTGFLLPQE